MMLAGLQARHENPLASIYAICLLIYFPEDLTNLFAKWGVGIHESWGQQAGECLPMLGPVLHAYDSTASMPAQTTYKTGTRCPDSCSPATSVLIYIETWVQLQPHMFEVSRCQVPASVQGVSNKERDGAGTELQVNYPYSLDICTETQEKTSSEIYWTDVLVIFLVAVRKYLGKSNLWKAGF